MDILTSSNLKRVGTHLTKNGAFRNGFDCDFQLEVIKQSKLLFIFRSIVSYILISNTNINCDEQGFDSLHGKL